MDRATDATIQRTLRAAVAGNGSRPRRMLLVIAHRIDTMCAPDLRLLHGAAWTATCCSCCCAVLSAAVTLLCFPPIDPATEGSHPRPFSCVFNSMDCFLWADSCTPSVIHFDLTASPKPCVARSMDCDMLLVLSAGRLVEHGEPGELAARPGGAFARLARAANAAAAP